LPRGWTLRRRSRPAFFPARRDGCPGRIDRNGAAEAAPITQTVASGRRRSSCRRPRRCGSSRGPRRR
jgi:hypothetical protein